MPRSLYFPLTDLAFTLSNSLSPDWLLDSSCDCVVRLLSCLKLWCNMVCHASLILIQSSFFSFIKSPMYCSLSTRNLSVVWFISGQAQRQHSIWRVWWLVQSLQSQQVSHTVSQMYESHFFNLCQLKW